MITVPTIASTLAIFHVPGSVFEVRIPKTLRAGTVSGYFNDCAAAEAAIARWDGKAPGIYFTINSVDPALMARAPNCLAERSKDATSDKDITHRRWLLIDVDYERPAGISATDEQLQAAMRVTRAVQESLTIEGWPDGILAHSGNGGHLFYCVDLLNDNESRDLLKRLLVTLAAQFDEKDADGNVTVHIDTTVFNAARIAKVPGTMACKGYDTPERPHRRSHLLDVPPVLEPVSAGLLLALAGPVEAKRKHAFNIGTGKFDVETFIAVNGINVRKHKGDSGGDLWELQTCPFNPEHNSGEAFITRAADGSLLAGCHHNSCDWRWHDLREKFEPGYREKQLEWERGRWAALEKRQANKAIESPPPEPEDEDVQQTHTVTSEEALHIFASDLDRRIHHEIVGLPWPAEWPGLSRQVGPLEPGSLTVIAARPSIGKTMMGMQLQRFLCSKGHSVLFVSRELSIARLIRRHVCALGGAMMSLRYGEMTEANRRAFDNYQAESRNWQVRYDDRSRSVADIRKEMALHEFDIVIIDYLQRLAYDTEKEYAAITRIVNELQDATLETGVPIVCLSQLSRPLKGFEWKQPSMSDTRGSGAVEERAANLILLHRQWETVEEDRFGKATKVAQKQTESGTFIIAKCADGEAGGFVKVIFNGARMTITERL